MHCCIPTPATDSNPSTGMIWVTLNMPSAANRQGIISEFHIVWRVVTLYIYLPKRMLHSPEIRRVVAEMAGLTLALVCVAAAGLLVVIEWEAWARGPVINQGPHQVQNKCGFLSLIKGR